jgi:hypothetical protein
MLAEVDDFRTVEAPVAHVIDGLRRTMVRLGGALGVAAVIACGPAAGSTEPMAPNVPPAASASNGDARATTPAAVPAPRLAECSAPDRREPPDPSAATGTWVHAAFFKRVRDQAIAQLGPELRQRSDRDTAAGARKYGDRPHRTAVRLCLSRAGELVGMTVVGSSGIATFDEDVVRAFREAAPFLNPPEALVEPDGLIRFELSFETRSKREGEYRPLHPARKEPR